MLIKAGISQDLSLEFSTSFTSHAFIQTRFKKRETPILITTLQLKQAVRDNISDKLAIK